MLAIASRDVILRRASRDVHLSVEVPVSRSRSSVLSPRSLSVIKMRQVIRAPFRQHIIQLAESLAFLWQKTAETFEHSSDAWLAWRP